MSSLRERMAEHGFESNDDYEFEIRCLLESRPRGLRALNVAGDGGRRKSAFANALARALGIDQIIYHDFTDAHPPQPEVILPPSRDELGREEPPIAPLDLAVSEACAQSEGESTVLILDQLQSADFREHIRIHRLVRECRWQVRDAPYDANRHHLLVFLVSEEALYHALHKESYRVWVGRDTTLRDWDPREFGLDTRARGLFTALAELFHTLGQAPTRSELEHLIEDLRHQIHTREHLRRALYGRVEGIDHAALADPRHDPALDQVLATMQQSLRWTEHIEITGGATPPIQSNQGRDER
ncbi:hypothetical protein L0E83_04200 [Marichromatium gracile]|uniref:hypothetical protein n=1 Tax=Marichromatium gracile TaxID=1048 RepID=UPI001F3AABFC|nr:hypothetical protein [Marichromatium gracile]MCF1182640.1 hypothetical protein [Marichromatium gracile]